MDVESDDGQDPQADGSKLTKNQKKRERLQRRAQEKAVDGVLPSGSWADLPPGTALAAVAGAVAAASVAAASSAAGGQAEGSGSDDAEYEPTSSGSCCSGSSSPPPAQEEAEPSASESEGEGATRGGGSPATLEPGVWPKPKGTKPPGWPPSGSELLSSHTGREAAGAASRTRQALLAALPCPQPSDPLKWRLYPLARQALALEAARAHGARGEEEAVLDAVELLRFISGNLPTACLAGISKGRLRGLVTTMLARSTRRKRLLQKGKRYALPGKEAAAVFLPDLPGRGLEAVWVAWCTETKRPRQAALRFGTAPGGGSAVVWVMARPGVGSQFRAAEEGLAKDFRGAREETVDVLGTEVRVLAAESGAIRADWWTAAGRTAWATVGSPGALSPEGMLEVVTQCLQQLQHLQELARE